MSMKQPDERQTIATLCGQLDAVADASGATAGCQTLATIMTAARCARRTGMPAPIAAALLAEYIVRGDPV